MADDYNIGNFGEFDRFEDERAFMPEAFERPQSTIGGYDKKFGYTLPSVENENPDNWFWGYNNPDDAVQEQQHGVWPSIKRNSPEWVKDIGKGLHDTGKLFYDHGRYSDDILDFFGWQPQDNYYSESMNERFNWDQLMDQVSGKRHPYEGALAGAIMGDPEAKLNALRKKTEVQREKLDEARRIWDQLQMDPLYPPPGPWNEFDPHSRFEEYIDNMNMDEGGSEWSPSEEYLGGTSEVAQSQWKRPENMEKTIQSLKLRPEFEGWTDEAIKTWIYNTARANRGGIIGLI